MMKRWDTPGKASPLSSSMVPGLKAANHSASTGNPVRNGQINHSCILHPEASCIMQHSPSECPFMPFFLSNWCLPKATAPGSCHWTSSIKPLRSEWRQPQASSFYQDPPRQGCPPKNNSLKVKGSPKTTLFEPPNYPNPSQAFSVQQLLSG